MQEGSYARRRCRVDGVSQLRDTNPEADGHGMAGQVMDTGCDPAALPCKRHDEPKYVDFLDCTAVAISTQRLPKVGRRAPAAPGAMLTLGAWADLSNPVGAAPLWTLLPGSTRERVLAERKELFGHSTPRQPDAARPRCGRQLDAVGGGRGRLGRARQRYCSGKKGKKTELEARLRTGRIAEGRLRRRHHHDVVAFRDEHGWRAVVDAEGTGDLTDCSPMAPFGVERQLGTFGFGSACTFCLQIGDLDDGGALSIVCDAGSHGTHVAGIVAANFEAEDDAADGVAPGGRFLLYRLATAASGVPKRARVSSARSRPASGTASISSTCRTASPFTVDVWTRRRDV